MESKLARNKISSSTQGYLDIAEIKGNTIVLRDGSLRSVLLVSSINFALKSEEEQDAIIASYVSFLNNLDFYVQIVVQSRELNIDGYIEKLKNREKEQTNELLKLQTADYIKYIEELISMGKIMSKRFYIIVPYNPESDKRRGFFASLLDALRPVMLIRMKEKRFQKLKSELDRRVEKINSGLASMGLNAVVLDTQGLIELFYTTYNPSLSKNQNLAPINELRIGDIGQT